MGTNGRRFSTLCGRPGENGTTYPAFSTRARWHLNLTTKSAGRDIDSDFVHVITLADGKWVRFRDFMNTAVAVQAFS